MVRPSLKAGLLLLNPRLELLLEVVRRLIDGLGQEVVAGRGREAYDNPYKLPWQVR
jgi:hypothetical protein